MSRPRSPVSARTLICWSLVLVPIVGMGALVGLVLGHALLGAALAGIAAGAAQTAWLLWAIVHRLSEHEE